MRKRSESFYAKTEEDFSYNMKEKVKRNDNRRSRVSSVIQDGEEIVDNLSHRRRDERTEKITNLSEDYDELGSEKIFTITQNPVTIEEDELNLIDNIQKINSSFQTKDKEKFLSELSRIYKHILKEKQMGNSKNNSPNKKSSRSLTFDNLKSLNINFDLLKNFEEFSISEMSSCADSFNSIFLEPIISQNIDCVDETLKFIFIGDQGVGKSFLISKLLNEKIEKDVYIHTNSFGIKKKNIKLFDKTIKLEFWDTNVEIMNSAICEVYYKISDGVFLIIDPTKPETITFIEKQIDFIIKSSNCVNFFLVANLKFLTYDFDKIKEIRKQFVEVDKQIKLLIDKYDLKIYYINIDNLMAFKNSLRKYISLTFIKKGLFNKKEKNYNCIKRKNKNKCRNRQSLNFIKKTPDSSEIFGKIKI